MISGEMCMKMIMAGLVAVRKEKSEYEKENNGSSLLLKGSFIENFWKI